MSWTIVTSLWAVLGSASLQAQVDGTPVGGTLTLEPGEYAGPITIQKPIRIKGSGLEKTRLRVEHGSLIVVTARGGLVVLEGLELVGPQERDPKQKSFLWGGALRVAAGSEVVLDHVLLRGSRGADFGGAIFVEGTLRGTHVRIEQNHARMGGGGLSTDGQAVVELSDSVIAGNGSEGPAQIVFSGKSLVLRRVVIRDPSSETWPKGGQLSVFANPQSPAPEVLLDTVVVGPVNRGSPVAIGKNPSGTPLLTLVDTEWPKDAEVPSGWSPSVVKKAGPGSER